MTDAPEDHAAVLSTLAACDTAGLKQFADQLLADIEAIEVHENRTGLVMLPMRDTVQGTAFHLGEVLMSEARIEMAGVQGYGLRTGRDLEAAMAMAVVDAAWQARHAPSEVARFIGSQARILAERDAARLRDVEATRVNMETF